MHDTPTTELAAVQPVPHVYKSMLSVMAAIAKSGIAKSRRNKEQAFNFRGVDEAFMAFASLLVMHSLLVIPSFSNLRVKRRSTAKGGITYSAKLDGTFTFVSVVDGSERVVGPFFGEANDGQDRAVSKASSVAERNMFFYTFVAPHEPAIGGDPDASGEDAADSETAQKDGDWVRVAKELQRPADYDKARADMVADYGKVSNIPPAVREAFNYAKARVMPKDQK
jgi:ERF superfamily